MFHIVYMFEEFILFLFTRLVPQLKFEETPFLRERVMTLYSIKKNITYDLFFFWRLKTLLNQYNIQKIYLYPLFTK